MSRPPPSYMSKDDLYTLNAVRKDIWSNAIYGLTVGSLSGLVTHSLASQAAKRGFIKLKTNRNTAMLSLMLGGSIGSFVMATTTGKNEVHQLHGIFESGSRESRQGRNDALQRAVEREDDLNTLVRHRSIDRTELSERVQREKNRLIRRASLEQNLKSHHGLSDSHGGHWATDDHQTK